MDTEPWPTKWQKWPQLRCMCGHYQWEHYAADAHACDNCECTAFEHDTRRWRFTVRVPERVLTIDASMNDPEGILDAFGEGSEIVSVEQI